MIPAAPAGTPQPVVVDSSSHLVTSTPDIWRNYALPSDIAVEKVKANH